VWKEDTATTHQLYGTLKCELAVSDHLRRFCNLHDAVVRVPSAMTDAVIPVMCCRLCCCLFTVGSAIASCDCACAEGCTFMFVSAQDWETSAPRMSCRVELTAVA
jgi:hypothetical protein